MLVWGFFISTVFCYRHVHDQFAVARVRQSALSTGDTSRNNWMLAILTLGEGWHNNHHYYPNTVKQGFYWWEIDVSYYILKVLSWLGVIWDLKPISIEARDNTPRRIQPVRR
jgi:stearoyl-CoA desaturase (delta-9 desaturase)